MKRGALIVIEGMDRTGKSTQCKALVESLRKKGIKSNYKNFPARQTVIGGVINSYLLNKNELPDEAIHLLFSANRWEESQNIVKMLEDGFTLILDRYCYSGVAFSAAKGLDINWCKAPDAGLPRPDKVFYLTATLDTVRERKGFGGERYEVLEFQKKVSEMFEHLKEDNWEELDANRSIEALHEELLEKSINVVNKAQDKPIEKVWL